MKLKALIVFLTIFYSCSSQEKKFILTSKKNVTHQEIEKAIPRSAKSPVFAEQTKTKSQKYK